MLSELLQYQRDAVAAGEWWRFATASFVHWSFNQLLWDGIAFAALAFIAAKAWPARFSITLIASALAVPMAIHFFMPDVTTYRGLSGIDSALFALIAVKLARQTRSPMFWLCMIGFAMKIGFEMFSGSTLFVRALAPGVASLPIAHLIGAAIGIAAALLPELHLQCTQLFEQSSDRILESLHTYGEWFS